MSKKKEHHGKVHFNLADGILSPPVFLICISHLWISRCLILDMKNRQKYTVAALIISVFTLASLAKYHITILSKSFECSEICSQSDNSFKQSGCAGIIEQRDVISRLLNLRSETLSQLRCEHGYDTSTGGGYCTRGQKFHMTDLHFAEFLKTFLKEKRVASFGEGLGIYKKILSPYCKVYDAYDGAPYTKNISNGTVHFLDLSVPQYGLPIYDIVISLEVGEHIPKHFEQIFLNNVAIHASEAVLLSWAHPGQGGYEHINEVDLSYLVEQMSIRGFHHEKVISKRLKGKVVSPYLRENLNYYTRRQVHTDNTYK